MPAYNEEQTIAKVVVHAAKHVDKVLVVDDGSRDDTGLIAERLGAVVIRHERNLGRGAALRTCFSWGRSIGADILVTFDADGQHDPEEIPSLIDPMLKGEADIVIGKRYKRDIPAFRRFGARVLDHVTGVKSEGEIVDAQSGFRAYSRKAFEQITATEKGMGADSQLLMRATDAQLRIIEVPITVRYHGLDTSTHNPLYHGLDVLFSAIKFISIRHPLLFYGGFSIAMFIVALLFGIWTIEYYAKWGQVVTNLALVSVFAGLLAFLSFFTGVILFTLISVLRENQ